MMKLITERTAIPISLVVVLVGGVLWFARLEAKVDAASNLQADQIQLAHTLNRIDRRLSRMEGKLGIFGRDHE